MALELRIAGPGLDTSRRLEPGEPPLVLGRDVECSVCLPDPQKNVSRRHLSVWNDGDELHFHVLSVVNGIDMPFGEAPPGARGVLPLGQTLKIAEYALTIEKAEGANKSDKAAPDNADPWAQLDADSATRPAPLEPQESASTEPDPFGEWGFETTFGSDQPGAGGLQASGLKVADDIKAFFTGLGFEPSALSSGELESMGRIVRMALLGLVELRGSMGGSRKDLRAEDRTMLAPAQERNPLTEGDVDPAALMQYIFGGRAATVGFLGPERAVRDLIAELLAHEKAAAAASRAVVEGTIKEFEPEALKDRLLGGGAKLFESARAWDAFVRHYEEQGGQGEALERWVQRLLDKHFTGAYLRESMRVKRDTGPRER